MNQSERLGESIYCSRWFDGSLQMRKNVLFIIQMSQKPVGISVSGILPALTLKFYASVSLSKKKRSNCSIYENILVFSFYYSLYHRLYRTS